MTTTSQATRATYTETFDDGPGGWCGWRRQGENILLDVTDGVMTARGPWGVDSYHAPFYLSLITYLHTRAGLGLPIGTPNRFIDGGHSRDLTDATLTVRLRSNMHLRGANITMLVQADVNDTRANFILTGQQLQPTPDWSTQTLTLTTDPSQWLCIGARQELTHRYGYGHIADALRDVNVDIIIVLFPLTLVPPEPTDDIHHLRPEIDYPIDYRHLPNGEIQFDTITIDYPD